MTRLALDTNTYTAFKAGDPAVVRRLQGCEEIHITVTVIAELLAGFKAGSKEDLNRDEMRSFLDSPRVVLDRVDEGTAEFYAHIYLGLRVAGTPIPTNDMWIAASAMQHGCALYSLDTHYRAIGGLLLV